MSEAIRNRAFGAFIGLAVGDALGTTLEFEARDARSPVYDMVGGGPFDLLPGQWTDDTSMALCLVGSLTACDGLDLPERFCRRYQAGENSCTGGCFYIGTTTRNALDQFQRTGDPIAGPTDARTGGNGSIMRLAPVAVRYWKDAERLRDVSQRQSYVTHGATEAVDACEALATVLAA